MADEYLDFIRSVHRLTGLDLNQYKRPQMERRILSLMRSIGIKTLTEYVPVLQQDKNQLDKFMNHLTINVSEFYRNPGQWEVLAKQIIPELLKHSPSLKIWSAGCSTGEEPYTIAMVLSELDHKGNHQIIAADVDKKVLKRAQEGIYNIKAAANLPKVYLDKYFDRQGEVLKVKDNLKRFIKFKSHNLLTDAGETNVDLLVCRNVVIYFTEEAKTLLYRKFQQSLKPNGILFIGSTEQIFQPQEIGLKPSAMFFYQKI
ncbi:MAG: protein-glutamate O-methyltransferase CheR [Carboxydocellales bacterium]